MAEVILPPIDTEPEVPEEQLPEVDKPTELSKVITIKFNPLDTGMTSTANTRQSFYTTDTDAWVVFEIENMEAPNGEYSLVLYNKSDGSVFQRTGDIVKGAAYYKIEEEEIKHAGDWVGQVVITLVNGKTTTSRFSFNVAGHLLDGKDVRQIVIQDFETLMKQLNGLKDDAEIDFRTLKNDIEESQRVAEQNELERVSAENERKQAELLRDENYDSKVDAAIVEADVVTKVEDKVAELSPTIQNVTAQLAQTESNVNRRVDKLVIESGDGNAEVADAHVSTTKEKSFSTLRNRIEEIEKESNLMMKNNIINGDFNGTLSTGWLSGGSTHKMVNGQLEVTGNGAANYSNAFQQTGIPLNVGDKWFVKFKVTFINKLPNDIRVTARGGTQTSVKIDTVNKTLGTPYNISRVYTATDTTGLTVGAQAVYSDSANANGAIYLMDKVVLINLTKTFGSGYEPSELEMMDRLKKYNDSYFEGKVNAFDYENSHKNSFKIQEATKKVTQFNDVLSTQIRRNQITTRTPYDLTVSGSYTSKKRPIWIINYDDEAKCVHQYGFPVHQSENVPGSFFAVPNRIESGNVYNYGVAMTWADLLEMKNAGWEIGHHTVDHLNTSYMNRDTLVKNVENGNSIFAEHGIFPNHFSHPGGSNTQNNSNVLKEYFDSSGLTTGPINGYDLNPWRLSRTSADSWYNAIYNRITQIAESGEGWLISYHHAIHPNGTIDGVSGNMTCWTPTQLRTAIQYAKSLGVEVVTMDEGLRTYAPYMYYFDEVNDPSYAVQRNGIVKTAKPIV